MVQAFVGRSSKSGPSSSVLMVHSISGVIALWGHPIDARMLHPEGRTAGRLQCAARIMAPKKPKKLKMPSCRPPSLHACCCRKLVGWGGVGCVAATRVPCLPNPGTSFVGVWMRGCRIFPYLGRRVLSIQLWRKMSRFACQDESAHYISIIWPCYVY